VRLDAMLLITVHISCCVEDDASAAAAKLKNTNRDLRMVVVPTNSGPASRRPQQSASPQSTKRQGAAPPERIGDENR